MLIRGKCPLSGADSMEIESNAKCSIYWSFGRQFFILLLHGCFFFGNFYRQVEWTQPLLGNELPKKARWVRHESVRES